MVCSKVQKSEDYCTIKRALKKADALYLATDEDREGEAIAWHLVEVLNLIFRFTDGIP